MSKNKMNKRVGLFLLAIITILGFTLYDVNFNAESNVYAAGTNNRSTTVPGCGANEYKKNGVCKCNRGYKRVNGTCVEKKKINLDSYITASRDDNIDTVITVDRSSDLKDLPLRINIITTDAVNKNYGGVYSDLKDSSGHTVTDNFTGSTYTITEDVRDQKLLGKIDEPYVLIISAENDYDGKYYYVYKTKIIGSEDDIESDPDTLVTNVNFDTKVCSWARDEYAKYTGQTLYDDYAKSVYKALPSCFCRNNPTNSSCDGDNKKTTYNMSYGTLVRLQNALKRLETDYKTYDDESKKSGFSTNGELPALGKTPDGSEWIKVNNTDLSKKTRDDDEATDITKSGYELAGSEKSNMLTCSHRLEDQHTYKYLYYEKSENKASPMVDFTKDGSKTTDINVCKTNCREQLIVSFGPPKVVSTPGQCFTYKVEVKSTTTCVVDIHFDKFPSFIEGNESSGNGTYEPCGLSARCGNNSAGYIEQAGPGEEFDSCVQKCDGGNYSKTCVNKCYNSVYKNKKSSTTKKTATTDEINGNDNKNDKLSIAYSDKVSMDKMVKLANEGKTDEIDDSYYQSSCPTATSSDARDNYKSFIVKVYKYVNQNITGKFYSNSNHTSPALRLNTTKLYYKSENDCLWSQYGYPYFRTLNLAARTVCNDSTIALNYQNGKLECNPRMV